MVTHHSTNLTVSCLNMGERAGSLVLNCLWPYVTIHEFGDHISLITKVELPILDVASTPRAAVDVALDLSSSEYRSVSDTAAVDTGDTAGDALLRSYYEDAMQKASKMAKFQQHFRG